jgi:hypothetical protein
VIWSRGRISEVGTLTFDLGRAHKIERLGEGGHSWSECGGVSVGIVVNRGIVVCFGLSEVVGG